MHKVRSSKILLKKKTNLLKKIFSLWQRLEVYLRQVHLFHSNQQPPILWQQFCQSEIIQHIWYVLGLERDYELFSLSLHSQIQTKTCFFLTFFAKQLPCRNSNANTTRAWLNSLCKRFYYRSNGVCLIHSNFNNIDSIFPVKTIYNHI